MMCFKWRKCCILKLTVGVDSLPEVYSFLVPRVLWWNCCSMRDGDDRDVKTESHIAGSILLLALPACHIPLEISLLPAQFETEVLRLALLRSPGLL